MKATFSYDKFLSLLHLAKANGMAITITPIEDGEYLIIDKVHKNEFTTCTVHKKDLLVALEGAVKSEN